MHIYMIGSIIFSSLKLNALMKEYKLIVLKLRRSEWDVMWLMFFIFINSVSNIGISIDDGIRMPRTLFSSSKCMVQLQGHS